MYKQLIFLALFLSATLFFHSCSPGKSSDQKTGITTSKNKADQPENEGLYPIIQNGRYGYINTKGEIVISPQFEKAAQFREGLAYAESDGKYGFIDPKGKWVIPAMYDVNPNAPRFFALTIFGTSFFNEGMALVKKDGQLRFINTKGKETIALENYTQISGFSCGLAVVREGSLFYYIDKKGKKQFGRGFDWAMDFYDSLALVQIDGKTGYINTSGKLVIPNKLYTGGPFVNGYAVVKDNIKSNYWQLIDKKGKVILEKEVDRMTICGDKMLSFAKDRNEGVMDFKGNLLIPAKFDLLFGFVNGFAIAKEQVEGDNKFGIINKKGEWVVQPIYDGLYPAGPGMITVFNKSWETGELGYMDYSGKMIWKPTK